MTKTPAHSQIKLIIWIALLFSNILYAGIILFLPNSSTDKPSIDLPINFIIFIIGIVSLILSYIIPKMLKQTAEMSVEDFEYTKYIIGLALNESTSIFGFIIAYIYSDGPLGFTLMGISFLGLLNKHPLQKQPVASSKNSLNIE